MTSNVNDAIPVAGGTIAAAPIRLNFEVIKQEIEDLQSAPGGAGGTVTSVGTGAGLSGGPITGSGTIALTNTGVGAGTYQGLTVDLQGRVTSASNQNYATSAALSLLEARIAALEGGGTGPTVAPAVSPGSITGNVGTAITPFQIIATNPPILSYAVTPALPNGLSLNTATGLITGTPTAGQSATNYTITATNAIGTSPGATLSITVSAVGPSGWQVTYSFPTPPTVFNMATGKIPLATWTGWSSAFDADMNDTLYDAPTPGDLPVNMYAKYSTDADFRLVDFDNWGGTAAANKITEWGYSSGDHSVYIIGGNATGNAIQLRLVKH